MKNCKCPGGQECKGNCECLKDESEISFKATEQEMHDREITTNLVFL